MYLAEDTPPFPEPPEADQEIPSADKPDVEPLVSLKVSEKRLVWAWVVGAMPINATRAIRPRIPPKERHEETRSVVATARD